jgi:hypothetical protein
MIITGGQAQGLSNDALLSWDITPFQDGLLGQLLQRWPHIGEMEAAISWKGSPQEPCFAT